MAAKRSKLGDRKHARVGDVGRMLGELEGRPRLARGGARTRLWTETQPPNVKTGKSCM